MSQINTKNFDPILAPNTTREPTFAFGAIISCLIQKYGILGPKKNEYKKYNFFLSDLSIGNNRCVRTNYGPCWGLDAKIWNTWTQKMN